MRIACAVYLVAYVLVELATLYGRYGYRRITGLLRGEGWTVNHKRIEQLWRREGLRVPQKQLKRGRLWLADGSCIRRRPEYRHHISASAQSVVGRALVKDRAERYQAVADLLTEMRALQSGSDAATVATPTKADVPSIAGCAVPS